MLLLNTCVTPGQWILSSAKKDTWKKCKCLADKTDCANTLYLSLMIMTATSSTLTLSDTCTGTSHPCLYALFCDLFYSAMQNFGQPGARRLECVQCLRGPASEHPKAVTPPFAPHAATNLYSGGTRRWSRANKQFTSMLGNWQVLFLTVLWCHAIIITGIAMAVWCALHGQSWKLKGNWQSIKLVVARNENKREG